MIFDRIHDEATLTEVVFDLFFSLKLINVDKSARY